MRCYVIAFLALCVIWQLYLEQMIQCYQRPCTLCFAYFRVTEYLHTRWFGNLTYADYVDALSFQGQTLDNRSLLFNVTCWLGHLEVPQAYISYEHALQHQCSFEVFFQTHPSLEKYLWQTTLLGKLIFWDYKIFSLPRHRNCSFFFFCLFFFCNFKNIGKRRARKYEYVIRM